MTQKTSVNCSYNHGLAFASHSVCFSKHAYTIEILLIKCWSGDSAMCSSKAKLATVQPMYFCPHCLGSVLV